MVDPGRPPQLARAHALIASLDRAVAELAAARERVRTADGDLEALAAAHDELTTLLDRNEATVVGDGNFEAYLAFQDDIATFVAGLDEDLPHREAFETVDERLHQRRLTEADFAAAREALAPIDAQVSVLAERDDAARRVNRRRRAIERAIDDLTEQIQALDRRLTHADADLSADVTGLARPIATYDRRVAAAFSSFLDRSSARRVLGWLATTRWFPLVAYRPPPPALRRYVDSTPIGTEPLGTLREYAGYSRSKLDHYVDDAGALKRAVATHETYLRRLDATPLQIGWPPPSAAELRYLTRELTAVVDRIADQRTMVALREVRELAFDADYDRRREGAIARTDLEPVDRRRLQWGVLDRERSAAGRARERLRDALADAPDPAPRR